MDTLFKTMPNLVRKYQASKISSCSFYDDRNGMLKSLSKEAERVAFGLFTNGFPTPTSLRLALAEGRLGEMTGFIPLVNRTWQILNDCGAHLLTTKIWKHQESVAAKAGPLAFHMMCDGYGGRKMVFGSDTESAVDFCVQMGWDYWCHRRDHKDEDVTIQHVTITPLPFIDICKGTEGHDWLPTVAQLKNLAAQTPTAPEFKWMSRDGKWKNVSPSHQGSRKQPLDTPSSELLISPTDTVRDICRIMYQYHNSPTTVSGWSRGDSQRRRRPTLSSTSDPSPGMSVYKRSVRRCGRRRRWRQCLGTPPDNKHEGGGTGGDA